MLKPDARYGSFRRQKLWDDHIMNIETVNGIGDFIEEAPKSTLILSTTRWHSENSPPTNQTLDDHQMLDLLMPLISDSQLKKMFMSHSIIGTSL